MKMEDTDLYKEIQKQVLHDNPAISIRNLNTVCELKWRHFSSPELQKVIQAVRENNPHASERQIMRAANFMWHTQHNVVF